MYDIIYINNLYYIYNNLYIFFSSRAELCIIIYIMFNNLYKYFFSSRGELRIQLHTSDFDEILKEF